MTRRRSAPAGTILQTTLLRVRLYFAGECISRRKTEYFRDAMPIWETVGVSAVPAGLDSIFWWVTQDLRPGLQYAAPAGLELAGDPVFRTNARCHGARHFGNEGQAVCCIVTSVTSFTGSADAPCDSREAATDCSPGRKPWVGWNPGASPERAKETWRRPAAISWCT